MTTAYAERPLQQLIFPAAAAPALWVVSTNTPPQGLDADKVRDVVRHIDCGTAARGQSVESVKVIAAVQKLRTEMTEHINNFRALIESREELSYNHIPVKTAFSVQATYKFVGKLKPRQFPVDE